MLFIQLIYSCFSRYQVPINSVAPSSVYKAYTTQNWSICIDFRRANARNVSFSISVRWSIYIIDSVDKRQIFVFVWTWSSLFRWTVLPSVRCTTVLLLLCFLTVGIHVSGISIPFSLLMLFGWSSNKVSELRAVFSWLSKVIKQLN